VRTLDWAISAARKGDIDCSPVRFGSFHPQPDLPHRLVITGRRRPHVNPGLNVRCACMAELVCRPGYYNYDTLGVAQSLEDALSLYNAHLDERKPS
jgi:hypothetical protein